MDIDEIRYVGIINSMPMDDHNIFIFDDSLFEIYNDLYNIKAWPSTTIDLIENKLSNDIFSFSSAIDWMKGWEIHYNKPQYVIVKQNTGLYKIYCNYFEALIYFRHRLLKIPASMVSVTLNHYDKHKKYTSYFRQDYNVSDLYEDGCSWKSSDLNQKILKFLDERSMNSIYNYSYTPDRNPSPHVNTTAHHERRYIIEDIDIDIMLQLKKFQKQANKITELQDNPDITEEIRIYYGELSYNFNEKTKNFI